MSMKNKKKKKKEMEQKNKQLADFLINKLCIREHRAYIMQFWFHLLTEL